MEREGIKELKLDKVAVTVVGSRVPNSDA